MGVMETAVGNALSVVSRRKSASLAVSARFPSTGGIFTGTVCSGTVGKSNSGTNCACATGAKTAKGVATIRLLAKMRRDK